LLDRPEVDIVAKTDEFGNEKTRMIDKIHIAWLFDISRRDRLFVFSGVKVFF
jgi:hypothetical protein